MKKVALRLNNQDRRREKLRRAKHLPLRRKARKSLQKILKSKPKLWVAKNHLRLLHNAIWVLLIRLPHMIKRKLRVNTEYVLSAMKSSLYPSVFWKMKRWKNLQRRISDARNAILRRWRRKLRRREARNARYAKSLLKGSTRSASYASKRQKVGMKKQKFRHTILLTGKQLFATASSLRIC